MQPSENNSSAPAPRRRSIASRAIRLLLRLVGALLLLVVLAVGALYVPGVLNLVASKVLPTVEKSSGMKISTSDIRLRFPLRLSVDDAIVITTATADTMLTARHVSVAVEPLPLLAGKIGVKRAEALGAFYQMGGADSLYVGAVADTLEVNSAMIALSDGNISVDRALLAGARIKVLMGPEGKEKNDTAKSETRLKIDLGQVSLRRVDYAMNMRDSLATDTIAAFISDATLSDGLVKISPESIDLDCRTLTVNAPTALYGKPGVIPEPGLDMNWLELADTRIKVDTFAMRGISLIVPISELHTRERSGLTLDASGLFAMDSTSMRATGFRLLTDFSTISLNAEMGLDSVPALAPLKLDATAQIGLQDVTLAMPTLAPMLAPLPDKVPLRLRAIASGTMQRLNLDTLTASMQRVFSVSMSGYAANVTKPDSLIADLALNGALTDPGAVDKMVKGVKVPPISLRGTAKANCGAYEADIVGRTGAGRIALKGKYAGTAPDYSAELRADSLPVGAFMPDLGVGAVTATASVKGHGFDVWSPRTVVNAKIDLKRADYNRTVIRDVNLDASLDRGKWVADIASGTPAARLNLTGNGLISRRNLSWQLDGNVANINLKALGLTDSVMQGSLAVVTEGNMDPSGDSITAFAAIRNLDWIQGQAHLMADSITASLHGSTHRVAANVVNRALKINLEADTSLNALLSSITQVSDVAMRQFNARSVYADTLHSLLPPLRLNVSAGADNLINDYLQPSEISFRNLDFSAFNDSTLHARGRLLGLLSGQSLRIDTLSLNIAQRDSALLLAADMGNRPGTFDEFARVGIRAGMEGNLAKAYIKQQNIQGKTGYSLGLEARLADSLITVNFTPLNPVIAYKDWTFNEGNFVSFNPYTYHIDADLDAAGAGSRLQLFTHHDHETNAPHGDGEEDALTLKVTDVRIQDWLSINPFAPPIAGNVSADMHFTYDDTSLNGHGDVNLLNLTYGKERVGDFDLNVNLGTNRSGVINADVALMIDSIKTITATGSLNDSTKASPFLLDFKMIRLPLRVANPFLPADYARLSGTLNGTMDITGTLTRPIFNGWLDFDSAAVKVGMIGSSFAFSEDKVPVDSNIVSFSDFTITGSNANPLKVNGTVDLRSISEPQIDLNLNARDMMVVNSKKRKGVDIYGKAYIDLDAQVRGNLRFMDVNANLAVLPRTDVTYIYSSAESQIGLQNTSDMVHFVNFRDTAAVLKADTIVENSMAMMLNARLDVQQGSTITVDLSADGKNRAQIKGDGILNYTQTPLSADGRLTGRFTINEGFFRYSLPVISEKNFSFNSGSYVAFTGSMLNPTLAISAVDQIRANVTDAGNARMVNFDVILNATGTLEHMDVAFDLTTDDDLSVQNELRSMSPTQRANQAMNLLLYGSYQGPNTSTTNANVAGNALYGFLSSQLNSWAANTIKGVDLSFGVDQFNSTRDGNTATATQYSYKMSKSLFNNRFKIVVGGNYSTDASSDENLSENLISDISFEYMLNEAGSMYVRLFRHTGYESILEGEVVQTGVGFVLKRKIHRISDIFRFRRRQSYENSAR